MQCNKEGWDGRFESAELLFLPELYRTAQRTSAMLNVNAISKRLRNWNRYRTTVRELSQLTDRDLNDLGIRRGEIHFIAKKHTASA